MEHKEDSLQIEVAEYLRSQYPKAMFCHCPNGGNRTAIEGARLKRMGVLNGMPDIMVFEQKHTSSFYRSLAIELKIKPNRLTPAQQDCLKQLEQRSWKIAVCWSFEEAKQVIDDYLK